MACARCALNKMKIDALDLLSTIERLNPRVSFTVKTVRFKLAKLINI